MKKTMNYVTSNAFSHKAREGVLGWLLTTDHKRIGILYFVTAAFF
jgi:heme/copper-type cytochrome/quinol oxidase subunit 1